jgi:hypothetical protein
MAAIRDEYYVNLKGKMHPTWTGVLVALHENGLLGIEVTVLQYPAPENGNTAVCQATVTMKGEEGRELIYSEVGDANGTNVGHTIAPHIIRMAATRAKGRAGRDALALGVALVEELGADDDSPRNAPAARTGPAAGGMRAKHDPEDEAAQKGVCTVCGVEVTPAVAQAALKKFHKVVCIEHGREIVDAMRAVAEEAIVGSDG